MVRVRTTAKGLFLRLRGSESYMDISRLARDLVWIHLPFVKHLHVWMYAIAVQHWAVEWGGEGGG